jgi:general secretion pathway protein L
VQPTRITFIRIAGLAQGGGDFVRSALVWWLGEIGGFVPAWLREFLWADEHALRVEVRGDLLHIEDAGAEQAWDLSREDDADLPSSLEARLREGGGAVLVLPAAKVLRRTVELPLAAASELHAATSFLVERLTPFRLEQTCHAARPIARDKARKLVRAEMVVAPRQVLEGALSALAARGIHVSVVNIEGDTGRPPFDLIPRQSSRSRFRWTAREAWRPVLAAGLALLIIGPLTVAYRTHAEANALAAEVAEAAKVGTKAAALRARFEARATADRFISTQQGAPRAIEVLDALTKTLPDGTWVFRMDLRRGQVTLAGFSSDVPDVLQRLAAAPFTAPELTSPVVHGVAGSKSRFELRVRLKAAGP